MVIKSQRSDLHLPCISTTISDDICTVPTKINSQICETCRPPREQRGPGEKLSRF